MRYYTGLDISMKETVICIVNEEGKVVHKGKSATESEKIAEHLELVKYPLEKIGLESGSLSGFLTVELRKFGLPAICIDARKMAAILSIRINKTDANDAEGIAEAMRCNMYREVALKTLKETQITTLLKSRKTLVEQRTQVSNTIRGLLKSYGVKIGSVGKSGFPDKVRKLLIGKVEEAKDGVEGLLKVFEIQCEEIKRISEKVKKIAEDDPEVKRLMTIPGVGAITALSYKVAIGNPKRFSCSRKVGAYLGMTPRQYSSGESVRQGKVSKCGPKEIRTLLTEAALVLLTRSRKWSKLKAWGLKLMKKKGTKKATMAVGRKLAVIMHRMLIDETNFIFGEEKKPKENPEKEKSLPKIKKSAAEQMNVA